MPRVRSPKAELAAKPVAVVDAPPAPTTESLIADTRRNLAWPPGNAALTWNPDALQSSKGGLTIYDSMRVDEQVQAALSFRVACCIGPGWVLEPATNDPTDREFADLLTRDLIALPGAFERVLRELLTAIAYGYALGEATYRLEDTAMRLATVKVRAPHHLDFVQDGFGNVTGVRQLVMGPSEVVPINKFIHYVNQGEFDNPYGRSDLRAAYKPWFSKSFVWQLWMIWNERYADPPAYVNQPPGTTTQQRDEVLNILNRLQARTSFALPKDWLVSLLESGRQPREVFQLAIDRFDLAISRALLIPEKSGLSGGANTGGSFSLAQVQADTGVLLRNLEANALAACIQRQLIVPMASYRDATRDAPTFKLNPLTEDNVAAITTAFNQAVEKGTIISDGRDENHLRQLLKFPELGEAEQAQRDRQRAQDRAMVQVAAQAKANGGSQTPPDGTPTDTPPKGGKPTPDATMAAGGHSGVFVGMFLPSDTAKSLALPGGELASDLHVTVCYCPLGSALSDDDFSRIVDAVRGVAAQYAPLTGSVGGVGRFDGSASSDYMDVLVALPDLPGLAALRQAVSDALCGVGVVPSTAHGYTPHITLAYVDPSAIEMPTVPRPALTLDALTVRVGDRERRLPLKADAAQFAATGGFWRKLNGPELRADMAGQRATLDQAQADLAVPLTKAVSALIADLRAKVQRSGLAQPDANPKTVRELTLNTRLMGEARSLIGAALQSSYERSMTHARGELVAGNAKLTAHFASRPGLVGAKAKRFFKAKAFWATGIVEDAILAKAKAVLFNAIKGDKPERTVLAELDEQLNEWIPVTNRGGQEVNVPSRVEVICRTNLAEAWSEGRFATFTDPDLPDGFVEGLLFSAIMDDRTREAHAAWDGVVKPAPWWLGPPDRRPPDGFNCRCQLVPVFPGDGYEITDDAALPRDPMPDPGFR